MNEYLNALVFIILGFIGALGHYVKKRYWDNTTDVSIKTYILLEPKATKNAIAAIVTGEFGYAMTGLGLWPMTLHDLIGILAVGYLADSAFNKAPMLPSEQTEDKRL
jgi:hypothetical protein